MVPIRQHRRVGPPHAVILSEAKDHVAERTVVDEDTDFPLVARIDGADPLDVVRRREIAARLARELALGLGRQPPHDRVEEIARPPEHITRLPRAPDFIEGVMNLRGNVVPIVDLRRRFALVLVDSPPILPVSDARLIAPHTDGVLLLITAGTQKPSSLQAALERLRIVEASVLGLIINKAGQEAESQAGYYHYEPVGAAAEEPRLEPR